MSLRRLLVGLVSLRRLLVVVVAPGLLACADAPVAPALRPAPHIARLEAPVSETDLHAARDLLAEGLGELARAREALLADEFVEGRRRLDSALTFVRRAQGLVPAPEFRVHLPNGRRVRAPGTRPPLELAVDRLEAAAVRSLRPGVVDLPPVLAVELDELAARLERALAAPDEGLRAELFLAAAVALHAERTPAGDRVGASPPGRIDADG